MNRVCVFCGSSAGNRPAYAEAAEAFGRALARRGVGLVTGGGSIGMMGAIADAALAEGGEVIGVITEHLNDLELGHPGLQQLLVVPDMHTRKRTMGELADAFVAMPGGYGTLEEVFEAITWSQLNIHAKPVGLLNVDGYFDALVAFIDRAVADGFVHPAHRALLVVASTPEALCAALPGVAFPDLAAVLEEK
ncbi:MAG: TIGR00730 family Rossman fold protein [Deltaproteobacteria bacterium]|nr:TIGR00730 family Rossman fold protein [Deltaproteobacteria bacterium]